MLEHALQLNDPLYIFRLDHQQLAIAAANFILWLSYYSVTEGHMSSMLTEEVQTAIIYVLNLICDNHDNYYPQELQQTILDLKK